MVGRLVEKVNRLIRLGVANITEESTAPAARTEQALTLVRHKLGALIVERRRLMSQVEDLPPEARILSEKAELAVRKGREDLARAVMAEIARHTSGREDMIEEIAGLDADIALLETAIVQLTGETPSAAPSQDASLRALLAELQRLEDEPEDKGRRSQDT